METSESELGSQEVTDSSEINSQPVCGIEEDELKGNISKGGISVEEAELNYNNAGQLVKEDETVIKRENFEYVFTKESEDILSALLEELDLGFELSPFQIIAINGLLNGYDLIVIVPTGMGKMLVVYLFGLAQRKRPGFEHSMITVGLPLSNIMTEQLDNPFCRVAVLSMGGKLTSSGYYEAIGEAKLSTPLQDLYDGEIVVLFAHPEALASNTGQAILRKLKQKGLTRGLILDEFHQGQEGHWEVFRPGMVDMVMRQQVWMVRGSPVAAFSATSTHKNLDDIIWSMGRSKKPVVLAQNPIQSHHKMFILRRPPSQCPMTGVTGENGVFKMGLLHLLKILILDKLVSAINENKQESFKKTIIFFRTQEQAGIVHSYLAQQTGFRLCDTAPFVMNHSSVSKSDDEVMTARTSEILCWLTTCRMVLGRDIRGIDCVIMARPPDQLHALVQAMGRGGRRDKDSPGFRKTTLFYLLFNSQDIGPQMKNMSDEVRQLCLSKECSIKVLRKFFVGEYSSTNNEHIEQCCGNCIKKLEE